MVEHDTISPELRIHLPQPWRAWFATLPLRYAFSSLLLFCAWETLALFIPTTWQKIFYPTAATLIALGLALSEEEANWRVAVVTTVVVLSILDFFVWTMIVAPTTAKPSKK